MSVQRRPAQGKPKNGSIRWVVRYRDPSGKEKSKSFSTEKEAKAYDSLIAEKLRTKSYLSTQDDKITVLEGYKIWIKRPMKESSRDAYNQTVWWIENHTDLAWKRLVDLRRSDVDDWYTMMTTTGLDKRGALTPSGAKIHVARLSSAVNFFVAGDFIAKNPIVIPKVKRSRPAVSEIPTTKELKNIIWKLQVGGTISALYSGNENGDVARPNTVVADIVRVAAHTGLRESEILGLTVGDIDLEKRVIRVEKQLSRTGGQRIDLKTAASARTVPLSEKLSETLLFYTLNKNRSDFLFSKNKAPLSALTVQYHYRRAVRHLGYDFTFHDLRHYFVSHMIAANVPITVISTIVGHSSTSTTLDVYAHIIEHSQSAAINAVNTMSV